MQGRQNQSNDLMELAMQRLMFPKRSGYRSETGGLMEALRVLDVQTIREYVFPFNAFDMPVTMQLTMFPIICPSLLLGVSTTIRYCKHCRIKWRRISFPRVNQI